MIKILGHRGCAGLEPENTIRAFKKALNLGVDLIEFDVRATKDKELIVIHDNKVDRTANGKGYVKDFTFKEIRKLNVEKKEKIPSLKEVLVFLKNKKITIVIEVKEVSTLKQILDLVKKEKIKDKVVIISFWHQISKEIKKIEPSIKTGIIMASRPINITPIIKNARADFLCLKYHYVDKEIVKECHKNKIKINVWTIDENSDIQKMIKLKVDIISSNYPNRVLTELRKI